MNGVVVGRIEFQQDRQGRTFADVLNDPEQPFDEAIAFFNDANRQRRMEESEIHHNRAPLAGVVRELEAQPAISRFLSAVHARAKPALATGHRRADSHDHGTPRLENDWQEGLVGRSQRLGQRHAATQHRRLGALVPAPSDTSMNKKTNFLRCGIDVANWNPKHPPKLRSKSKRRVDRRLNRDE